jgi:uncharacterized membrane protein
VARSRPRQFIAIPLVFFLLGAVFLVLAAAAIGVWAWFVAGILIVVGTAYGLYALRQSRLIANDSVPDLASRQDPTMYNVLVLAGDRLPEEALRQVVQEHAAGRPVSAYVVAPAESSGLDRITGDQSAYEKANANLEAALGSLEGLTVSQRGKIGAHDPLQAMAEALREFPAEEIVVPAASDSSQAAETRFGVRVAALTS